MNDETTFKRGDKVRIRKHGGDLTATIYVVHMAGLRWVGSNKGGRSRHRAFLVTVCPINPTTGEPDYLNMKDYTPTELEHVSAIERLGDVADG